MSRARFPWNRLGIDETSDTAAIRKAYADALRAIDVDADIAGYAELRRAREHALWLAAQSQQDEDDGSDLGLGDLDDPDDALDDHADHWADHRDDAPGPIRPEPLHDAPVSELSAAQARAQAAWQGLLDILYPGDEPSDDSVTHAELEQGLAQLAVLIDHAEAAGLAEHDALDHALADLLARSWPRSAPFVEPANAALHWLEEAGSLDERPALMFLNARLKGMRFHEKVQRPDHPLHKAWAELSRPGRATLFDRLKVKRLEIDKLLTGVRTRYPELESHLDPVRVASWDSDSAGEGVGGTGPKIVRGIVIVLVVLVLPRLIAHFSDPASFADGSPIAALVETGPSAAEIDAQVAEIFGAGTGMADVRAADPVFADQLRLAAGRGDALAFVRLKALGAAEVADAGNLAVRIDLRAMWMTAAQRQSPEVCRRVMVGDFAGLDLALGDRQRGREQALLRQLLEARLLGHMPTGGEFRYSIPGWLVADALERSGLSEAKLVAALTDPASPDRCTAEAALIEAVRAASKPVPDDVLKGI